MKANLKDYKSVCYFSTSDSTMEVSIQGILRRLISNFRATVGATESNKHKPQSDKGSMSQVNWTNI